MDLETLDLYSPACTALRTAGVRLVVPLVSQGELIGLLNQGPRLSDQDYSSDDRRLLENLAAQTAPAVPRRVLQFRGQDYLRGAAMLRHRYVGARPLTQARSGPAVPPRAPRWRQAVAGREIATEHSCSLTVSDWRRVHQVAVRVLARVAAGLTGEIR